MRDSNKNCVLWTQFLHLKERAGMSMFTMDEVLSKRNQRDAFNFLERKKDSCGSDGMRLADLKEYWALNHEWIEKELKK